MSTHNPKEDGKTHINVYSRGKTEIGRMLSNFYLSPFVCDDHGAFASIEAYWYWLKTGRIHDCLRPLYGLEAKRLGKTFAETKQENFNKHIQKALYYKVTQNEDILRRLVQSTLPFAHYYVYGGDNPKVVELPQFDWMVDYLEKLRTHLRGRYEEI